MTLANRMRSQLARYTSNDLDMKSFRDWFVPVLRDVHKSGDQEAEALAHAVELEFVEMERGLASETVLKENISRLASVAVTNPPESQNAEGKIQTMYLHLPTPQTRFLIETAAGNSDSGSALRVVESNEESSFSLSNLELIPAS
jgi:hypothetical protein